MSQQQPESALGPLPPQHNNVAVLPSACTALLYLHCTAPRARPPLQLHGPSCAVPTTAARNTRCVAGFFQVRLLTRRWGVHCCALPASTAILARGTWTAKLAALAQNTQHSLSALPQHFPGALLLPRPRPLHFPSCARCSWTSTPSTQFARRRAPPVRLRLPLEPSRRRRRRRRRCAPHRACQVCQHSRAFVVLLPASLGCTLGARRCSHAVGLRASDALCCKLHRTLLTRPKQYITTSHPSAITLCTPTRAPGYLFSLDQHT